MTDKDEWEQYAVKSASGAPASSTDEWAQYAIKNNNSPEKSKQNPIMWAAENLGRYAVIDPAIGIGKLGESILNSPHYLEEFLKGGPAKIFGKIDLGIGDAMGLPDDKTNMADKLIQGIPEFAASVLAPETRLGAIGSTLEKIPMAGKYLKTALGNALTQSAISGVTAHDAEQSQRKAALEAGAITAPFSALAKGAAEGSPLTRAFSKVLMGLGGAGAGYFGGQSSGLGILPSLGLGLAGGVSGYKMGTPNLERRVANDVFKGVEDSGYKPVVDAAERLNLTHITPAEASNNPIAGATQGSLAKTPEGYRRYSEAGKARAASEKGAINNFLNTVFNPEELLAKKNNLYKIADDKAVALSKIAPFYDNEIFKKALNTVENDPAYRESLKGVSENSIKYMDHVKQAMDDMIEEAPKKKARLIKDTQKQLMGVMDEEAPEYQQARGLAERQITRNKIEDFFGKRPVSGTNFGKFLNSDKNYRMLQNNIRNVPEAKQQLADMKTVFGDNRLINLPGGKGAEALARSSMSKSRSSSQDWKDIFRELLSGGKYDKTAVDLIRNPNWVSELEKLKQPSSNEKLTGKIIDLFGKTAVQTGSQ